MSIPKEPRQLMINLMYLVLTAMLALNVSAEIFNAFAMVDKGLTEANKTLDENKKGIPAQISDLAKKDPEKYGHLPGLASQTIQYGTEFSDYIEEIKVQLIEESGGRDPETGKLKGYKNKDVTTRLLVGPEPRKKEGKGDEIESKIEEYRQKFLQIFPDSMKAIVEPKILLHTSNDWEEAKKASWAHYTFNQMPVGAVLPILTKLQNDAKSTEAEILKTLLSEAGGTTVEFNKFRVVSAPKKSYMIMGETFETDIFLSASASNVDGISISVNGAPATVVDGVASYKAPASALGVKKYSAVITITNPVTGEKTTERGEFEYEVGQRSAAISLDKMNVFYIGVPNPITVSAAGISSNELRVTGSGGGISITPKGGSSYEVDVKTQGEATLVLSGGGLTASTFKYRVKRIPDPTPEIGGQTGGSMGNGTFKAQGGLIANLRDFDFDARCNIVGYQLTRAARREDPVTEANGGAAFTAAAKRLVDQAKPGDTFFFNDIKAKCPGDAANRSLGSIVISIK